VMIPPSGPRGLPALLYPGAFVEWRGVGTTGLYGSVSHFRHYTRAYRATFDVWPRQSRYLRPASRFDEALLWTAGALPRRSMGLSLISPRGQWSNVVNP